MIKGSKIKVERSTWFKPNSWRYQQMAEARKRHMTENLSYAYGMCRDLDDIDMELISHAMTRQEMDLWARKAGKVSRAFNELARKIRRIYGRTGSDSNGKNEGERPRIPSQGAAGDKPAICEPPHQAT